MPYQVLIAALLMTIAGSNAAAKSRIGSAKAELLRLEQALEFLNLDIGRYPTTEEGLVALLSCPRTMDCSRYNPGAYVKADALIDPWGEPYRYELPGVRNRELFDLWSLGPDSVLDVSGGGDDLGNWEGAASRTSETAGLRQLLLGAAAASAFGAALGLPIYLWGILTAIKGIRTWRGALLGEPFAAVVYLAGVAVCLFLIASQRAID